MHYLKGVKVLFKLVFVNYKNLLWIIREFEINKKRFLLKEHSCNPAPIELLADVVWYSMCCFNQAASGLMMSLRNFSSSKSQPVCIHGFKLNGKRQLEEGTSEYIVMLERD